MKKKNIPPITAGYFVVLIIFLSKRMLTNLDLGSLATKYTMLT